jgi:RHS repeat-associated protein
LDDTLYVDRIAYDAKGQRALIAYGNGVMTRYAYDSQTFRLKRLRSERYSKPDAVTYQPNGGVLQDYGYDCDLVGNILAIRDRAPASGIRNNPEALTVDDAALAQLLATGDALNRRFDYDPTYRLLSATGRECDRLPDGPPWDDQPRCTDLTKTHAYTEHYAYDRMGSMLRLEHHDGPGGFTREFTVETANNRLRAMKVGDSTYEYAFDGNGNMHSEATSRHFEWNHADQMKSFRTQTEGAEPSVHAHYLYDSMGQRVKKLVRKQGGSVEVTDYVDALFEHHRWGGQPQTGENNRLHVMDDKQRVALMRLGAVHPDDRGPAVQFHLGDHLSSNNVVVDANGTLTNREEFTPYGETSFGSFAKKRYRFTGKERDEESGLNYHNARYFSPCTSRWLICDPSIAAPTRSAYEYASSCPASRVDPNGTDDKTSDIEELNPIKPGSENNLEWQVESENVSMGDQGSHYVFKETSVRTLNRAGLKSYLEERVHGTLTSFEKNMVAEWGEDPMATLTPFVQIGRAGVVGYEIVTGGSGNRVHTFYNRFGHNLASSSHEASLVNVTDELIGYVLLVVGGFRFGIAAKARTGVLSRAFGWVGKLFGRTGATKRGAQLLLEGGAEVEGEAALGSEPKIPPEPKELNYDPGDPGHLRSDYGEPQKFDPFGPRDPAPPIPPDPWPRVKPRKP